MARDPTRRRPIISPDSIPPTPEAGDTISGPARPPWSAETATTPSIEGYQILSRIGQGGMGVVFEAEQLTPRRRVALKIIRGAALVGEAELRMFDRTTRPSIARNCSPLASS